MFLTSLFGRAMRRAPSRSPRTRLGVESLEDRTTPTAGPPDQTFGSAGIVTSNFGDGGLKNDGADAVVIQPDGKTVVAGFVQRGTNDFDFLVARYNRDGTPDTNFASGTGFTFVAFNLGGTSDDRARAIALQPDGKIVVAGFATRATGTDFAVCRLTTTGGLDNTFDADGKQTVTFDLGGTLADVANDLVIQPDGKIVLAGSAAQATGTDFAVCRLTTTGGLDNTFDADGKQTVNVNLGGTNADTVEGVALTADGKIVLAGTAQFSATVSEVAVARLTTVGALDPGFAGAGLTTFRYSNFVGRNTGKDVGVQADGKIVVTGVADQGNGDTDIGVARLTATGSLDPTFDNDGRIALSLSVAGSRNDQAEALVIQPDGKLVIVGFSNFDRGGVVSNDVLVTRLLPNGQFDLSYNLTGREFYDLTANGTNDDEGHAVALGADGIVVAGFRNTASTDGTDLAVLRVIRDDWVIASADVGGPGKVRVFTPTGTVLFEFRPFGAGFAGGIRVAMADVNGDGVPDFFCTPASNSSTVRIIDGKTLTQIREIAAFAAPRAGGLNLTIGDVLGDNAPELVVASAGGGAPIVRVFDPTTGAQLKELAVFSFGITGGVSLTTANIDASGKRELVVAPQSGAPPTVRVFDVNAGTVLKEFLAFGASFLGGVNLAAGDVNNDRREDVIASRGPGGTSIVRYFSFTTTTPTKIEDQAVFGGTSTVGLRVAAFGLAGTGTQVIATRQKSVGPRVVVLDADTGVVISDFFAFESTVTSGLFITAVNR